MLSSGFVSIYKLTGFVCMNKTSMYKMYTETMGTPFVNDTGIYTMDEGWKYPMDIWEESKCL